VINSILGFLTGLTLAGTTAYVYLLDDYQQSSHYLLSGVERLEAKVGQVETHIRKMDAVERRLGDLRKQTASKNELEALRNELLKVIVRKFVLSFPIFSLLILCLYACQINVFTTSYTHVRPFNFLFV
jgi:hypothetical protein